MYDIKDQRGVPVSQGVPMIVRIAVIIGVIMIFVMGGLVVANSGVDHVWPSLDSTRIKL